MDQYIYKIFNYKNGKLNGIQIQCNFDYEHHHPFKYSIYKIEKIIKVEKEMVNSMNI